MGEAVSTGSIYQDCMLLRQSLQALKTKGCMLYLKTQRRNARDAYIRFIRHLEWWGSKKKKTAEQIVYLNLLLSGKLQNATSSLSAMPINRRCGLLFGKVSPPFRPSFIGCPLKRENGRHEMWPNVFFKPLRALEYGEFYWFSWIGSPYTTAVR